MQSESVFIEIKMLDGEMVILPSMPTPAVGAKLTDTQSIALAMTNAGKAIGCRVDYAKGVAVHALARALLDPEGYGYHCSKEMRDAARQALGITKNEYLSTSGVRA